MATVAAVMFFGTLALLSCLSSGCDNRDCAADRAGDVRCVSNRIETCNEDGTLTYEGCSDRGLVCSAELRACVTEEVAMTTTGSGGMASGGAGAGASNMGGAGGS
jgi:hypothetical protein